MRLRLADAAGAAAIFCALAALPAGAQERPAAAASLGAIYDRAIRDTNGDGLGDEIAARVILPAKPSLQEVQAAANLAARLGYETTAASLPVVVPDDGLSDLSAVELPILVGRDNRFVRTLVAAGALKFPDLSAGQGLVALVTARPQARPALVVLGADDAGTLAASIEVAARLPRLWSMTGVKLAAVERQAVDYLRKRDVAAQATATWIVVDAARRGIAELGLQVIVPPGAEQTTLDAFEALDMGHRRGQDLDVLDFASTAVTVLEVRTAKGLAGTARVRRTGVNWRALAALPPPPPPLSSEALLKATSGESPRSARPRFQCVGCPVYRVDGMVTGGGGASYSSAAPAESAAAKPFDLSDTYTLNGWFADRYRDLAPDATETALIIGGAPDEVVGAAHIAARLGLETTGITLPIAKQDRDVVQPANEPSPILVGRGNALVKALVQAGKVRLDSLKPGEGALEIVPRAFGAATATIVAGADAEGAHAASFHLARRLPFVWDTRPGALTLQDVKAQIGDFFAARSGAGQAAQALDELPAILAEAKEAGSAIERIDVKLYVDKPDAALAPFLQRLVERQAGGKASVEVLPLSAPVEAFQARIAAPWEGEAFWSRLKADVLPRVKPGDVVAIEARLSEDPSVRARIARDAEAQLRKAGARLAQVEVRSAYKQGFFWLTEQVLPALKSKPVKTVRIKVRMEIPDYSRQLQTYEHPARWIKALYPADAVLGRDLGLPQDAFVIEQADGQANVYSLEAFDAAGQVVYAATFDPSVFERNVLDATPQRSKVNVETGRFVASINGEPIVQARIETDLERVWELYQQSVLPKVRDYMLQAAKGLSPSPAPFFRDLRIDAFMSEPDYQFGIEGEHISAAEGLSQDLANLTSAYLRATGAPVPARVIPIVLPKAGQASELHLTLSTNAAAGPRVAVIARSREVAQSFHAVRELKPLGVGNPLVTRLVARADGVSEIGLQLAASDPKAITRATAAVEALVRLQKAGLYRSELSYDHVDAVTLAIQASELQRLATIPTTGTGPKSDVHASRQRPPGELVTWDHVINPPESEDIIRKLSFFPAVSAYRKARSYEGRDISVLEITNPAAGALVSAAKIGAYKPTALIVGRQHGNEPSSTSFILRLAEKLVADPGYADIVRKVNVVLLPVMNPDGAALAADIRKFRPLDIAGPGYLSALGQDVTVSTTLPESVVDPFLWRRWLPDIYLNAHGASSHEVVTPFNGYVSSQAPTYSFRRGWYSLAFRVSRDPRYPAWETAALGLREAMATAIGADPQARAGNLKDYSRFARWGYQLTPHLEQLEVYKGAQLFYSDPGSGELLGIRRLPSPPPDTPDANRDARIGDWPTVTLDAGTFEAADEGAQGPLLDLAARTGFAAALSQLEYLRDGIYRLERIDEEAPGDGATLTTLRPRPVMPPKPASEN